MRLLPTGIGGDRKEWGVGMGTKGWEKWHFSRCTFMCSYDFRVMGMLHIPNTYLGEINQEAGGI